MHLYRLTIIFDRTTIGRCGQAGRDIEVRTIAATIASDDNVLPRVIERHELGEAAAANQTGIGIDRYGIEATTAKDTLVGAIHARKVGLQVPVVLMEAIAVLHEEFTEPE